MTTFLSCTSNEVKPFEEYEYNIELKKVDVGDNRELFEVACFKRKYRIWTDKVGALETFKAAPVSECDKTFGFKAVAKSKWQALLEYVRKEITARPEEQERITRETYESVSSGSSQR